MSKRAFDKIRAGLDSARSYLDGSADKSAYKASRLGDGRPRKPGLDEMGPGVESIPARKGGEQTQGPRSKLGRPGMRGGFKKRER